MIPKPLVKVLGLLIVAANNGNVMDGLNVH
jgi:hypothetical protein